MPAAPRSLIPESGRLESRKAPAEMTPTDLEALLAGLHAESFGWALHCCGRDETRAEDVLQTAYLRVVSGKARYGGRSAFKTWLFGVIRRTAQEARRRDSVHDSRTLRFVPEALPDTAGRDPHQDLERKELRTRLLRALEDLSDRQREILHLTFYQGLTIAEGAEIMGISVGSARTHYERGKERLRSLLLQQGSLR